MDLSDEERAAMQASIERVSLRVAGALRARPGVEYALHLVESLHQGIDQSLAQAGLPGQAPACQAGCDSCCYLRVELSQAEALRIARQVRSWDVARQQALRRRLQQQQARLHAAGAQHPRLACVFLQDGLCSIYPWRPASCRKAHSFSAQQCRALAAHIPQDLAITMAAEALQRGTAQGYRLAGLAADALTLTEAMLWALDDVAAEASWYAGAD